jgi:hypothetical protein
VKVDWDKWQDEESENQESGADFDPESMEKLIDLMKKNGDWDESEMAAEVEEAR